jgi:hypothetical protein
LQQKKKGNPAAPIEWVLPGGNYLHTCIGGETRAPIWERSE